MSRKKIKPQITEAQILAQESSIPSIAAKAFRDAYEVAISKGESVLVVHAGQLMKVSNTETLVIRPVETYGTIKAGTRLKTKSLFWIVGLPKRRFRLEHDASSSHVRRTEREWEEHIQDAAWTAVRCALDEEFELLQKHPAHCVGYWKSLR